MNGILRRSVTLVALFGICAGAAQGVERNANQRFSIAISGGATAVTSPIVVEQVYDREEA